MKVFKVKAYWMILFSFLRIYYLTNFYQNSTRFKSLEFYNLNLNGYFKQ